MATRKKTRRKSLKRKKPRRTNVTAIQLRYWRNQDIRAILTDSNESSAMRKKAEKEFIRRIKLHGAKAYKDE